MHQRTKAFTIVELMVCIAIIAILISILLPSFVTARDRARYIKWASMSGSLRGDTSLALHYNFENQTGEETNKYDNPILYNKAAGDPMQLARGGLREDGNGQLGTKSDPTTRPTWDFQNMRFKGKGGLDFEGPKRQRVAINKTYGLSELPSITVGAWVWSANAVSEQILIAFDRSDNFRLALKDDSGNRNVAFDTAARHSDTSKQIHDMGTSEDFTDGKWHLVMGWYTQNAEGGGHRKRIYVDGKEVLSANDPHDGRALGQGGSDPSPGTDQNRKRSYGFLGVGSEAWKFDGEPGPTLWLDAYMDEAFLYERALGEADITKHYKVGAPRDKR